MEKKDFRSEVRGYYNKKFYVNNDAAHMIDHADEVVDGLLELNKEYKYPEKIAILTGYIHDIFTGSNRENHHILASHYVLGRKDKYLKKLGKNDLQLIADAVLQHRASYKGEFTSTLSEMISVADKGKPIFIEVVKRSLKYHKESPNRVLEVYEHLKDKFGTYGYSKYADMYLKLYGDELKVFNKEVDDLTLRKLENIVEDMEK